MLNGVKIHKVAPLRGTGQEYSHPPAQSSPTLIPACDLFARVERPEFHRFDPAFSRNDTIAFNTASRFPAEVIQRGNRAPMLRTLNAKPFRSRNFAPTCAFRNSRCSRLYAHKISPKKSVCNQTGKWKNGSTGEPKIKMLPRFCFGSCRLETFSRVLLKPQPVQTIFTSLISYFGVSKSSARTRAFPAHFGQTTRTSFTKS